MFEGRTALVTGGGRGIGRAIVETLAEEGAAVGVSYVNDRGAAEAVVAGIVRRGGRAHALHLRAERWDSALAAVREVAKHLGPIDILVNNAGIVDERVSVADLDPEQAQHVLIVNAMSALHVSKAVIPAMRDRGRGHIIMISSSATAEPGANRAPYTMGKAAMEALATSLAVEERSHGIRVNVIAPGWVDTDMGRNVLRIGLGIADPASFAARAPFGRFCAPQDIAQAVRYLTSPAGSYITGQRIGIDAGGTRGVFVE